MSIPTIVGVKDLLKNIKNNEQIVLDGEKGLLIKNPTNQTINFYKKKIEEQKNRDKKLNYLKKIIPRTTDNVQIKIEANIDNSSEAKESMKIGIDGIGLFRSEYLFMNKKRMPSENEQYDSLKKTLKYLKGKPLTIRTLDVGNDKKVPSIDRYLTKSPKLYFLKKCFNSSWGISILAVDPWHLTLTSDIPPFFKYSSAFSTILSLSLVISWP